MNPRTQIGDIFYRPSANDHWMIMGIKCWDPDIYQFSILNIESGLEDLYTCPFGDSLPDLFIKVA